VTAASRGTRPPTTPRAADGDAERPPAPTGNRPGVPAPIGDAMGTSLAFVDIFKQNRAGWVGEGWSRAPPRRSAQGPGHGARARLQALQGPRAPVLTSLSFIVSPSLGKSPVRVTSSPNPSPPGALSRSRGGARDLGGSTPDGDLSGGARERVLACGSCAPGTAAARPLRPGGAGPGAAGGRAQRGAPTGPPSRAASGAAAVGSGRVRGQGRGRGRRPRGPGPRGHVAAARPPAGHTGDGARGPQSARGVCRPDVQPPAHRPLAGRSCRGALLCGYQELRRPRENDILIEWSWNGATGAAAS